LQQPHYNTISKFIKDYRSDEKINFLLPFISQVTGSSPIKFNLELQVKNNLVKK
jgi:hypothetical protein